MLVIGQLDNTEKYVDLLAYIDRMPILWESLAMPPYLYKVQEELGEDWNKTTLYGAFENLLDEIRMMKDSVLTWWFILVGIL